MDAQSKEVYLRVVKDWRSEVKALGARIDNATTEEHLRLATIDLSDMCVRARTVCDHVGATTYGTESLDELVHKILDRLSTE